MRAALSKAMRHRGLQAGIVTALAFVYAALQMIIGHGASLEFALDRLNTPAGTWCKYRAPENIAPASCQLFTHEEDKAFIYEMTHPLKRVQHMVIA
jgi:hypothetical protein